MTIPPKPAIFSPARAPAFVELKLSAYKTAAGGPWWEIRPLIHPRLQLVHTNGASREGSIESAINVGNANPGSATHPHYQVDRHRAAKLVPTDRKGIGNATAAGALGTYGNVSDWSIVIETADEGYPTPGEACGFIGEQVSMIAEILAYEAIVHRIPLVYPVEWWGSGTATHTDPFGYPYWSIYAGKVCPGYTKKQQMRTLVLPLARQIYTAWTAPDPEEPVPLKLFNVKPAELNKGALFASGDGVTAAWLSGPQWDSLGNPPATELLERAACRRYTLTGPCPDGYHGIWGQDAHT